MPFVNCRICKKEFYIKPSHLKLGYGKYCSRKCSNIGVRTGKIVICDICGKSIWRTPRAFDQSKSGKFFCSKSCQTLWRNKFYSGERHPNWKGGEHQEYRRRLLETGEKLECEVCGNNDIRVLIVHHIDKSRSNNEVKNLVWLCMNCHFLVHYHGIKIV